MKGFAFFFFYSFIHTFIFANDWAVVKEDSTWETSGILTFSLQQIGFSNWAQGGESALTYGAVFNFTGNKTGDNYLWKNNLRLGYGLIKRSGFSSRKNNDLIILVSDYGKDLNEHFQISAAIDIRSQFSDGYKYTTDPVTGDEIKTLVSGLFAPAYIQPSIGFTYKKEDHFSATISPISNKLTLILKEELALLGLYGVEVGKKHRTQLGSSVNISFNKEVMENVNVKSNLLLFSAYNDLNVWDVNYELFIDFKINKLFTTNFLLQAIYDDDIKGNSDDESITGPALQIRHVLNLGLTFNIL